ncbi:LysR family transcriptional regulator [Rhodobacteraceae bacterium RKSG542]|uniref:LysR family transcriptional regulator n=1 Tax=Pseudovibrio flavus TaxID=2529854 RepID=UPI0012BD271D|nr:LysR family transcriptional regulator [Pseudovibrio flavus]MTI19072.1 LysR family transcriptional regulator [Pseudovibrio flavus]
MPGRSLDWDKLRIFHAAAQAGSFTHAGEALNMSQSAVSRQVSALEADLGVALFHRHARGLIPTEQGEMLFRTAREVLLKLEAAQSRLTDSKEKPSGLLRVTTTVGLGSTWLTERINEFIDLYPDMRLEVICMDDELDLTMREADVAIRLRQPTQPDLIQRKLFTVHFHVYASPKYLERFGSPTSMEDLSSHRIVTIGGYTPPYLRVMNFLETAGLPAGETRDIAVRINNLSGIKKAVQRGMGIAILPDYMVEPDSGIVRAMSTRQEDLPSFDTYFVYPSELKNTARVTAFRDFLVSYAERWNY